MQIEKFTSYRVTGNTYAFRDGLKKIGGRWDAPSKCWIVQTGGMSAISGQKFVLGQAERGGCTVEEIK